jgi:hypothetical protein
MALTDAQKNDVVRLLGWPGKVLVITSTNYNSQVISRLTNLTDEIESDVGTLLERVEGLDMKLDAALGRAMAIKVGDIELNPEEMNILRRERKRVIRELSELLDIPIVSSSAVNVGVCV